MAQHRRGLAAVLAYLFACLAGLSNASAQMDNPILDFLRVGADQKEALQVNEAIYQATGFGNTFLVTTPEGNVIIDTSMGVMANRHHNLLRKVSDAPIKYIILTHGHGDHTSGVAQWKEADTEIITQRNFPEFQDYQRMLAGYFNRSNAAQFNFDLARLTAAARARRPVEPTILVDDRYEFTLGGLEFVVMATPGETYDHLTVWIPKYKAAFVGDNFYDSFPNIYTLRGTRPRWPLEYIAALNKVLALKPEIVLPSHGEPIVGKEKVQQRLTKYRDAIQYVHDATVKGMNEGKDVYTLMDEVRLPAELDVGEAYGKVSWSVRGIYEGYVGWFDRDPASMYAASPNVADADLVEMAGGAAPVAAKSQQVVKDGDAVRGLRLADAALTADPKCREALEARLAALDALQKKSRNSIEHGWLGHGVRTTQKQLDDLQQQVRAAE
ncbi:MAG: MBL fold metallo-hydrolase [Planctomycetota bacterium]|nr:MAG: MBL fold metallo-hydrolase [Planctomycetota bacterium]